MTAPPDKSQALFESWKNTIDDAKQNPAWNGYDTVIKITVDAYNEHLKLQPKFVTLNWKLIKAMVWTESGGPNSPAWKTRPMQIGNPGDPGLAALLSGKDGGELILPEEIGKTLTIEAARTQPVANIQAGTGYLLMRAAKFDVVNTEDPDDTVRDYTVGPKETFTSIAANQGSTVTELQMLNPDINPLSLQIGQKIKLRKAQINKRILGFEILDNETVMRLYNSGIKDPKYADKLAYCLSIIG